MPLRPAAVHGNEYVSRLKRKGSLSGRRISDGYGVGGEAKSIRVGLPRVAGHVDIAGTVDRDRIRYIVATNGEAVRLVPARDAGQTVVHKGVISRFPIGIARNARHIDIPRRV